MIVKIYVECMCDYDYLVHIKNSLDLYNSLVINNLLEESEENIIMCAYYYKEVCEEAATTYISSHRNNIYFAVVRHYSEAKDKLYE